MARPLRIQDAGLTYHVTARGNAKMAIFLDNRDRRRFLRILCAVAERHRLECAAHCLMDNHYHLLARTGQPNLSRAIQNLNGTYARWWNWRHKRTGHVFQGRFGAQIVQDDRYLLTACRYIVLNPVRAKLVDRPEDWPWSSHRATLGAAPAPAFLECSLVLQVLGDDDGVVERYRRFVDATPEAGGTEDDLMSAKFIVGAPPFETRVRERRAPVSCEVPSEQRAASLESLFTGAITRASRNATMTAAYRQGHSLAAIARFVGLHYSTVSKVVNARIAGSDHEKTVNSRSDPRLA